MKTESTVILRWVEKWQCFLLESYSEELHDGLVLQDIPEICDKPFKFWSCLGVLMRFLNRDKITPHRYKMTIEDLGTVAPPEPVNNNQ
jgi:hypothetical protein